MKNCQLFFGCKSLFGAFFFVQGQYFGGETGYNRKNHFEYEAHKIIEPNIYDYILGNIDYKTFINNIKNKNVLKYRCGGHKSLKNI